MARIETMACRLVFGRCGSGSGRGSTSGGSGRRVLHSKSAFHIVTSGCSGLDGTVRVPGELAGRRGRVRRHPQPPQLSLPVRCLVSDAMARRRPRPCHRLPTGGRSRLSEKASEPGFRPEGGNPFPDVPFELSGAQARAPGVFPQPSKTAVWTQSTDIKGIKPIGRLSDSVR